MKYCTKCGNAMGDADVFCASCGAQASNTVGTPQNTNGEVKWFDKMTDTINRMSGGAGAVRPPLKSIFSKVFEKHTSAESEEIFICGTATTTPELSDDGKAWPHPWIWSRIFLAFFAAFILLYVCCSSFSNTNAYPGFMVIGSFMMPIATMVFFFELNTPKNISFFTTIKHFLVGGCASLVVTLLLYDFLSVELNEWLSAVLIGIIEECGKLAIVAFVIWRNKNTKYLLNGLLIGAAIGAGFAAFESAGYAFNTLLSGGFDEMVEIIFLRAFLAPGGHVIWAAMSGYAIMLVKGNKELSMGFINQKSFWKVFWIPIALHAVWDMPIQLGESMVAVLIPVILLSIIGWVVIFVFIGNSLSQIEKILNAPADTGIETVNANI